MLNRLASFAALLALAAPAVAQGDAFVRVALRVTATRPNGDVVIDRGRRELLQQGDKVVLLPRNGVVLHGTVQQVEDRTAVVQLIAGNANVQPGTKGEVMVPRKRQQPTEPEQPPPVVTPEPGQPKPQVGTQPPDDDWRPGMPLLSGRRPPRPEERGTRLSGRTYAAVDMVNTLDTFNHSFARLGADVELDNLAGHGGTLRFHGDLAQLTETSGQTGSDLRVYELSYSLGGTRFSPHQLQFGRFLSREMPEFGLLDGAAWGYRQESGHQLGASVGYLPEMDEDLDSFADLQVAAWYLWSDSVMQRLTWGLGVQKTWHHGNVDRDLVIAKVRRHEPDSWDLAATAWIDFYYGSDQKDVAGLSRMRAHAARRWSAGSGLEFVYDHEEYPDQDRRELPQTLRPATLLDAHNDRLSVHTYSTADDGTRWHGRASGYVDEERYGGAAELGFALADLVQRGGRSGATAFAVRGSSNALFGLRIDHGGPLAGGRLDLLGEVTFVHHEGFPDDRDDLLQYRLGGLWSGAFAERWSCTLYGDSTLWDDELSFRVGFYLQRNF